MSILELTPAARKQHRAAAHHLHPVVAIGHDGASEAVMKELDAALAAHGLVKLRVFSDDRAAREALLARLADALGAAPIQHIGKLLVLWRPPAARERLAREDRKPGPRLVKVVQFGKSGSHRPQVKKIKLLGNQRIAAGGALKRAKKARLASIKRRASD
jgi:putative YhbY family RNA-binding protein